MRQLRFLAWPSALAANAAYVGFAYALLRYKENLSNAY
jgi:hypothetical protein